MKNYIDAFNRIDVSFKEWAHSTKGIIKSMKAIFKQGDIEINMLFNEDDLEMLKHSVEMAIDEIRLSKKSLKHSFLFSAPNILAILGAG